MEHVTETHTLSIRMDDVDVNRHSIRETFPLHGKGCFC